MGRKRDNQNEANVLECVALKKFLIQENCSLQIRLSIALKIVARIQLVHENDKIHKCINPSTILIHPLTFRVVLVEPVPFYNNGKLETAHIPERDVKQGSYHLINDILPYISPEQTDRTDTSTNKRSDFYSLGAVLYELLTGQKAFKARNSLGLIHSHIAKDPERPSSVNSVIPDVLSDIVMKLLEKSPDARYQSAAGVKNDLEICFNTLSSDGSIDTFDIGGSDLAESFRLTDKFYGRDRELELISQSYGRVVEGASEILAVAGYSGIGKTSLIFEFAKRYLQAGGPGHGKFEKFQDSMPFSAIVSALSGVVSRILTKDKSDIDFFKKQLLKQIDTNGQLIVDLIPEIELIIGPQPKLPELDTVEAQKRFNLVFLDFIFVLSAVSKPLVLFIDDVQWIDPASLALLEGLGKRKIPNLLVLCAYRDNEISSDHKIVSVFEKLQNESLMQEHIALGPLGVDGVKRLIADTFLIKIEKAAFLSDVINEKSGGNPYYIKEILTSLNEKSIISFENISLSDQELVQYFSISENVAALVTDRINTLSEDCLTVLKTASCVGRTFSVETLVKVCDLPVNDINNYLQNLVRSNYLIRSDETHYSFAHDRIQEAAHFRVNEAMKSEIHYRTGTLFLAERNIKNRQISIFEILNHLNNAGLFIRSEEEKIMLAKLNLEAGLVAKNATAYNQAFDFLKTGIAQLTQGKWVEAYDLTLSLFIQAGEIAFQLGGTEQGNIYLDEILANAESVYDKVNALQLRIVHYTLHYQLDAALETGREGLALLGIKMPGRMSIMVVLKGLAEAKYRLFRKSRHDLLNLPALSDPKKEASITLLSHCFSVAIIGKPEYIPFFVFKILNITLKYGETSSSAFGFCSYGTVLCEVFGKYKEGYDFGRLALQIADKYDDNSLKSKVNMMFGGSVCHWQNHVGKNDEYLLKAYKYGTQNCSELQFAGFSMLQVSVHQIMMGKKLEKIEDDFNIYGDLISKLQQERTSIMFGLLHQVVMNLKGDANDLLCLKGAFFDEHITGPVWERGKENIGLLAINYFKMMLEYQYRSIDKSEKLIEKMEDIIGSQAGMLVKPHIYFFASLIYCELYPESLLSKKKLFLKKLKKYRKYLKQVATACPENFYCMHALVEAEFVALKNKNTIAPDLYDKSIKSAGENGYNHFEAIANECAGYFYLKTGKKHFAKIYMIEAKKRYAYWGAAAKVKMMEDAFPAFFTEALSNRPTATNLDLVSIIKASQAIAGENEIEPLVDKLMTVVIENAGAREGFLIVRNKKGASLVMARVSANKKEQPIVLPASIKKFDDISKAVVRYTERVGEIVVLSNASKTGAFTDADYFKNNTIKSVLCIPIKENDAITGVMYLENNMIEGAFTPARVEALQAVTEILVNARSKKLAEEELGIYQEKLRALSSEVLLSEEKERRTIARGLHDQIGQSLTLSRMQLGLIKKETGSKQSMDKVDDVIGLINQTISDTRNLTFELSPPDLYELGLEAAIDTLSEKMLEPHGIKNVFTDDMKNKPLNESSGILIYQAVREILFNIVKHADSGTVQIRIEKENDNVKIVIKDDGIGFDLADVFTDKYKTNSFGLFSVRERMHYHGGKMKIESEAGMGTCVTLLSPLNTEKLL